MADVAKIQLERRKKGKAKLRISIEPSDNGGHVIEHHMLGGPFEEPKQFVFGKGEGKRVLAHISKHMGISDDDGDEE